MELEVTAFPSAQPLQDQLRFILQYAVLAPSSHNSQPWLFELGNDQVDVLADRTRALPVVDPDDRELTISCGACVHHLVLAIRRFGLIPEVTLLPEGASSDRMARIAVSASGQDLPSILDEDLLFVAIMDRRTNRFPYEHRRVEEEVLQALLQVEAPGVKAHAIEDTETKIKVAHLVAECDRIQLADKRFRRELAAWVHPNRSAQRDGIPGYAFGVDDLPSEFGAFVIRTFDIGMGKAAQDEQLAEGSPLLLLLETQEDNPKAWLEVGQALSEVLLKATSMDLAGSYLNQPIEQEDYRSHLASLLGLSGHPQLLLLIGYPRKKVLISTPRRAVAETILSSEGS